MNQVKQARHGGLIQNSDADTKAEQSSRGVDIAPSGGQCCEGKGHDSANMYTLHINGEMLGSCLMMMMMHSKQPSVNKCQKRGPKY